MQLTGSCHHVTETNHGRFLARRIPSRNYGIASRHGASRNITNITESITAHHGAKPITDNHGTDALECCQGASRRVASLPRISWLSDKDTPAQRITEDHSTPWRITEYHGDHGTSWTSRSSSRSITERSPSRTITARINSNHITGITAWMLNSAVISRLSDVMEDDQTSRKLQTVTEGSCIYAISKFYIP